MLGKAVVILAAGALSSGAAAQRAQTARTDTASCDSIVAAARVDSVASALYIGVKRSDGGELAPAQIADLIMAIGVRFTAPKPFRVAVFAGPPRMRTLRLVGDTAGELRAPTLTGVYRFTTDDEGNMLRLGRARVSLVAGLDSEMLAAIRDAAKDRPVFVPPDDDDSMTVDVRVSTDSIAGSRRLLSATFPRMPVRDAEPLATNPGAAFPREALIAGMTAGEVVLRFVVGPSGAPVDETIELVRGTSLEFVHAAMSALPLQAFRPATIHGCAVPQLVDYAFSFVAPSP